MSDGGITWCKGNDDDEYDDDDDGDDDDDDDDCDGDENECRDDGNDHVLLVNSFPKVVKDMENAANKW